MFLSGERRAQGDEIVVRNTPDANVRARFGVADGSSPSGVRCRTQRVLQNEKRGSEEAPFFVLKQCQLTRS